MSIIHRVEIHTFTFEIDNVGLGEHSADGRG